jgi:hypothetical protein
VIIFLIVICVNADSTKAIKSEQYVALTGGTNGFGAKYSYCIGPVSMDFGLPFLYLFGDTKKNDTVDTKDLIKINPYLSANLIFFKKERATVSIGVAWVAEGKIDRGGKKIDNAWIEKNASDNFFTFDYWLGPIFEYNQRGKNNYKLFGMQMLPVKFHLDGRKSYISDIGVQLNFYLRKIEHLPKEDD